MKELSNTAYRIAVSDHDSVVHVCLRDLVTDFTWCDAPYLYSISLPKHGDSIVCRRMQSVCIEQIEDLIRVRGIIAGLEIEHDFILPAGKEIMEERIRLFNRSEDAINVEDFEAGFSHRITDSVGHVLPEYVSDRVVAIPFRIRAAHPTGWLNDFSLDDFVLLAGSEMRIDAHQGYARMPSRHRSSEGWAWTHGGHTLGVFKFNQEGREFSVISTVAREDGLFLRFGGACMVLGEPSALTVLAPGQKIELGVTRYQTVKGDYAEAMYAYRAMLDEKGCRFPRDFNPPVHWNELYDNPEWALITPGRPPGDRNTTRAKTYTRELIELEAAKANAYHCEALYLDPGWDTAFGTFQWGRKWLGPRKEFIQSIKAQYGLEVSLHCPLAPWMSLPAVDNDAGIATWPQESYRMDGNGNIIKGAVCLSSKQYLEEAAKRLLELCDDGVGYLMFDGNWWTGPCWNPHHGHPVPLTMEDHIRANVELAQAVHARHPKVLIEMHDMLAGGAPSRPTPVYYKYGLPGSYDENWGFELMWNPLEDLRSRRAHALYYYNLACNIPVYLHVDLRDDNEHCLIFWWFASTCRHLGFGGSHASPAVIEAQKNAMHRYRHLDRFFKRGDFFGINEEIHLHVLPEENAFVVNVFNLSDAPRRIQGWIPVAKLGIDPNRWYARTERFGHFDLDSGFFRVDFPLPPWGTQVMEFHAV